MFRRWRRHPVVPLDSSQLAAPPDEPSLEVVEAEIDNVLSKIPIDFGGGTSNHKALSIARLLVDGRAELAIDVGVYRGRSFMPMAVAFRALGAGQAVGVDPYTTADAMQTDEHEVGPVLKEWTVEQDWDALYESVIGLLAAEGLSSFGRIQRQRSQDAAATFERRSVDLVHIDGNHDRASVERDLELYRPLVKVGGYIVLDDISWASVKGVYDVLCSTAVRVEEYKSPIDDYAVFHLVNG